MKEMLRKKSIFWVMLLMTIVVLAPGNKVQAADKVYIPDRAVRHGNYIFYAIGNGGGYIHSYNVKTKKDKILVKDICHELSAKGNYIYYSADLYGGSDYTAAGTIEVAMTPEGGDTYTVTIDDSASGFGNILSALDTYAAENDMTVRFGFKAGTYTKDGVSNLTDVNLKNMTLNGASIIFLC